VNADKLAYIKKRSSELLPELINLRRHFHAHPELSFQEVNTAAQIAEILEQNKISFTGSWAGHGIVAVIEGQNPDKNCVALRADMDALPITESNQTSYISTNKGVMHACGHDVHMTSLIGAARILNEMKHLFSGTVKLIFQPGEEKLPGGASIMIKEGVLDHPKPSCIIAQHVYPSLEAGKAGIRPSLYMASADEIYLTVTGKGGHAAMPHDCKDAVLATAHILTALQQVVSRLCPPALPAVLSFGKIYSEGGATNVLPDRVFVEGTFRTMDESFRDKAHQEISQCAKDVARAFGTECEVHISKGYPCLVNDEQLTRQIKSDLISFLGEENVVDLPIRMTSEDFAFFTQQIPGCFYRLGTANHAKGINAPVHTSNFDVDEQALETGVGLMAWLALNRLTENTHQ
jgi:amidohydrolase